MMKKSLLIVSALLFSSSCMAEQWYVDGGLGFISMDGGGDKISPTNLYVRGGYNINSTFDVGIESSVTVSPDQIAIVPGVDVDLDIDIGTIYIRAGMPVGENTRIYGQIGSSNTTFTASAGSVSVSDDESDTMLGFGADIGLSDSLYLALNYSQYYSDQGDTITGINVGIGTRF